MYASLIRARGGDCIAIAPSTAFAMSLAAENIANTSGILQPGS